MRRILPALVAVVGCAAPVDTAAGGPSAGETRAARDGTRLLKVFILSGQSNMEGVGKVEGDEKGSLRYHVKDPATAERFRHLVHPSGDEEGKWVERDDVWIWSLPRKGVDRKGKLTAGYGAGPGLIGPELQFGHVMGDHFDDQVLLIKIAWGGRSLAGNFRPPSSGGQVGDAYRDLVKYTREVLGDIKAHFPGYDGRGYEIAGFGWHQGWNDGCGWDATREYETNMANFIRDIRKEFDAPGMPFVIANSGFAGWKQSVDRRLAIMKAQAAVAEYDEFKGNVTTVETRDFYRGYPSRHNYHWNSNGETYFLIGDAMGKAMVKLLAD